MQDDKKLMLFFECGSEKYAIDCIDVAEVIPRVGSGGSIEYHGSTLPLIDFTDLQTGKDSPSILSTRIIMLNQRQETSESIGGLIAEKVLHTERFPESQFINSSSLKGISKQQIVTANANIAVIDPAGLIASIKNDSDGGKKL